MIRPLAVLALVATLLNAACTGGSDSTTSTITTPVTPVTPTPTMTAGRIASEPVGAVLVSGTTILTAEGFTASDNSAISYAWDLGNGTTQTGLASVRPTYTTAGLYIVRLTATSATGARATATLELRVGSMTGRWRLIDAAGATLSSTAQLTQNGLALTGDDQMAGDCRWTVSGVVADARLVLLTWTRTAGACAGRNLPNVFTFTGTGNVDLTGFPGSFSNVTGGTLAGAGRLVPCGTSVC